MRLPGASSEYRIASSKRPGSPSSGGARRVSNRRSSSARRAAIQSVAIPLFLPFLDFERRRAARGEQRLDLLLGAVEDHRSTAAQLHAFLERAQTVLERKISALEPVDDSAQSGEDVFEAFRRRFGLALARHRVLIFYFDLG